MPRLFFVTLALVAPYAAVAADFTLPPILPVQSIPGLICLLARLVFWLSIPLALLAILFAGLLFLTAGGSEQRLSKAKEALSYALIGWAVVLAAQGIAIVMITLVGGQPVNFTRC